MLGLKLNHVSKRGYLRRTIIHLLELSIGGWRLTFWVVSWWRSSPLFETIVSVVYFVIPNATKRRRTLCMHRRKPRKLAMYILLCTQIGLGIYLKGCCERWLISSYETQPEFNVKYGHNNNYEQWVRYNEDNGAFVEPIFHHTTYLDKLLGTLNRDGLIWWIMKFHAYVLPLLNSGMSELVEIFPVQTRHPSIWHCQ